MESIDWLFTTLNNSLDIALPYFALLVLLAATVVYAAINLRQRSKDTRTTRGNRAASILSLVLLFLVEEALLVLAFWFLPELLAGWTGLSYLRSTLRWAEVFFLLVGVAWYFGHRYGDRRWLVASLYHYIVLLLAWCVDRWMGILFIGLPLLGIYYYALARIAPVVIPVVDLADRAERRRRTLLLLAYAWGFQRPMVLVDGHAWKEYEPRIAGDFNSRISVPGLIQTQSHQVAGITSGSRFARIAGPGTIFTNQTESIFQIVDLRMQYRSSEIDVVSKDGISFKARISTAFRIDPEVWDSATYEDLRTRNPLLRGANTIDPGKGSFPFVPQRVRAALSTTSIELKAESTLLYWDQRALSLVEEGARQVIARKKLNDLWMVPKEERIPNSDTRKTLLNTEKSPLDRIAEEIKELASKRLRFSGILLVYARVVGFSFSQDKQNDAISRQQLTNWGAEWERKSSAMLATAQAESEKTQQEARAYAESMLLNSIAEGLQKAQQIHGVLPRYVIAMRFLSALQDYIHKGAPAEEPGTDYEKKTRDLLKYLDETQNQSTRSDTREKLP